MTNKTTQQTTQEKKEVVKPTVEFTNCKNCGEEIKALVEMFTGRLLGDFVLDRALEEIRTNNKKIEAYKEKLLGIKGGNHSQ